MELQGLLVFWSTAYGVIVAVLMGFFAMLPKHEISRDRAIRYLIEDTIANKYRAWLTRGLNRVDKWLSAPEIRQRARKTSMMRAWSAGVLSVLLILALAYPLLSLFAQWVLTGVAFLGSIQLFQTEANKWLRFGIGLAFLLQLVVTIFAQLRMSEQTRRIVQIGAAAVLFIGSLALAVSLSMAGLASVSTAQTVAIAATVVLAAAVSGAVAVALSIALALVVAATFRETYPYAGAVGFALAFVIAGKAAAAVERLRARSRLPVLPIMSWAVFGLIAVTYLISVNPDSQKFAFTAIFFCMLPLLNGLADFISIGATRYFLRRGLSGNMVINGIWDVCVGLSTFFILGFAIIAYIHWVRPQDGAPLLALDALFDGLRDRPGNHWWLFFMMFSTLLPTALHFILWLFAGFTLLGGGLRRKLARGIKSGAEGDAYPDRLARIFLCLCLAASIWVPLFVLIEGMALAPGLVQGVIGIFEGFAQLIGAVPAGQVI